jgi:hypothetical protein
MLVVVVILAIAVAWIVVRSMHGRARWGCLAALFVGLALLSVALYVVSIQLADR